MHVLRAKITKVAEFSVYLSFIGLRGLFLVSLDRVPLESRYLSSDPAPMDLTTGIVKRFDTNTGLKELTSS